MNTLHSTFCSKYHSLVNMATDIMQKMNDPLHNHVHMQGVVQNTLQLLETGHFFDADPDVCLMAAYWHDVGRSINDSIHEQISANMLYTHLQSLGFPSDFADKCYNAIVTHRSRMKPNTVEGKILYDADKMDFASWARWEECLRNDRPELLCRIVQKMSKVRDNMLHFEVSRKLFDKKMCELIQWLYDNNVKTAHTMLVRM